MKRFNHLLYLLVNVFKALLLASSCTVLSVTAETIVFTGKIVNEIKQPVEKAKISIAEQAKYSDTNGQFKVILPEQAYYQVTISKPGYYARIFTYSRSELAQLNSNKPFKLMKKLPGRLMIAFGGDVMMGRRYYHPYFDDPVLIRPDSVLQDSKAIVAHVKPYLSIADIAAVNLETQLAAQEPPTPAKKSVTFYSRPETVAALQWAGVDYVSLGNNHTYDYLDHGLRTTLDALDSAQMPYSGAGFNEHEALKPYVMETNEHRLALLGYNGWHGRSVKQTADETQGGAAFGGLNNIHQSVGKAVQQGLLPIVQYHGGLEYVKEPTGVTEQRLKAALDNGAALAVGHHPHVTQGLELYQNKLIAYSLGNFIFDQNFSATQHSFILYVWLDDGQFTQAEMVPIYIKGYKPTPAMDSERHKVLKRLASLSAKRNTQVVDQHGHGVILPILETPDSANQEVLEKNYRVDISQQKVHPLPLSNWSEQISQLKRPESKLSYRLGRNLVNGSGFEQFSWFTSPERGFELPTNWQLVSPGFQSDQAMQITLAGGSRDLFGIKHFKRDYQADNPMTVAMRIKAQQAVTLNVYWQGRKNGQKLMEAFKNSPKQLISSHDLTDTPSWQSINVDFDSPRIGYKSYRVLIEVVNQATEQASVAIDDFALVQWHTPYQQQNVPFLLNEDSKMSDYLGVNTTHSKPLEINSQL